MLDDRDRQAIYSLGYQEGFNEALKKMREYTKFIRISDKMSCTATNFTPEDNIWIIEGMDKYK